MTRWMPVSEKLRGNIFEEEAKWQPLAIEPLPEEPRYVAPTAGERAWQPAEQVMPTEAPTMELPSYAEGLRPEYAPKPWYATAMEWAMKPFEWLREEVEKPVMQFVTGKSEREYEKWAEEHKLLAGVGEFMVSLPLFMIPFGGLSIAGSRAIAGASRAAGFARSAKVIETAGRIIPAVEKALVYPIAKPMQMVGKGLTRAVTKPVAVRIVGATEKGITVGPWKLPTIERLAEEGFTGVHLRRVTERWQKVPGLEWFVKKIDPSVLAASPEARLTISYGRLADMGDSATNALMAELMSKPNPIGLFGIDDLGFAKGVTARVAKASLDMDTIMRFPSRYNLTPEQLEWVSLRNKTFQPMRNALKEAGILEKELTMEEEGGFLGRIVKSFKDPVTGQEIEIRSGNLFTRGVEPRIKPRIIENYDDAIKLGYRYEIDPRVVTFVRLSQGFDALARQEYVSAMLKLEGVRTFGAKALPQRIARDEARRVVADTNFIINRLNRVARGEKLTKSSLDAIARRNPEIAGLLGATPTIKEIRTAIKGLNTKIIQEKALHNQARSKAAEALAKTRRPALIEEGAVWQPGFGNRIFPKKTAEYINRTLTPDGSKFVRWAASAQGVVRFAQTGVDLGPYFLQGLPTLFTNPAVWGKTVKASMEGLFNPKAFYGWMAQPAQQATLAKIIPHGFKMNVAEMVEAGMAGGVLQRIPGVGKFFGRWSQWFNFALDGGRIFEAQALLAAPSIRVAGDAGVRAVVDHLGKKWGVMSMRWMGITEGQRQVENAVLFYAARWTRSGIAMMKDALTRGGIEGALARDMVGKMMLGMTMTYYGFCKALGQEPNLDPSSGRFMTIQIGTDHAGFGGMYIALARFGGNILRTLSDNPEGFTKLDSRDNPFIKFVRGRVAPLTGSSIDVITGKTFLGEPVDSPLNFSKYVALRNMMPFWLQNYAQGLVGADYMPTAVAVLPEFFGMRTWPLRAWERRDDLREAYAQQDYGKPYDELRVLDKRELESAHTDLKDITEEAWMESLKRGRPSMVAYGLWREERDAVDAQYEQALWDLQRQVDEGIKTPYDFRGSAQKLGAARAFALDHIDAKAEYADVITALNEPRTEPEITPQFEDLAFDIYTKLMYSGDLEIGVDDYDFEEADRRRQWFITTFGQETYDYVIARLREGRDIPPLMQEYYMAQEALRGYWKIRSDAEAIWGKPRTPSAQRRIDSIVARMRKRLRGVDPQVAYYYNLFYLRT